MRRMSCDPVGAQPRQKFMVCSCIFCVGSPRPMETEADRSFPKGRMVKETRITVCCVCQQSFPSSCDGTVVGFFHSLDTNPEGELWWPDSCRASVQKTSLWAVKLLCQFLRKCSSWSVEFLVFYFLNPCTKQKMEKEVSNKGLETKVSILHPTCLRDLG